jgi:hypothetical protein
MEDRVRTPGDRRSSNSKINKEYVIYHKINDATIQEKREESSLKFVLGFDKNSSRKLSQIKTFRPATDVQHF